MEIVINRCYGGFSLSKSACERLGFDYPYSHSYYDKELRSNPRLVECVRVLGHFASGSYAKLAIVEIPSDVTDWEINDYDGAESITYVLNGKLHHI